MKIAVLMPTINIDLAYKTEKILKQRAGIYADYFVFEDKEKKGFVSICNSLIDMQYDYHVYVTDDIFPSRNWLFTSIASLNTNKKAKMLGFNDGKWFGTLATCGIVETQWMNKNYNGNLFYPDYFGHYNDTELTLLARSDGVYMYNSNILMIEIDYTKDTKKMNEKDKILFNSRKKTQFDGRVKNLELINAFS